MTVTEPSTNHKTGRPKPRVVARYDYCDGDGTLLYQVERTDQTDPKLFWQRRPDGAGGWVYKLDGVKRVPYRLVEVLAAPADATIYIVEGEKDSDRLASLGLIATSNPQGAGKWPLLDPATVRSAFAGRTVAVLPDADDAGRAHAQQVARALHGIAESIKVVPLPFLPLKGDVSDWLDAGGTVEKLVALVEVAPEWRPAEGDADESSTSAKDEGPTPAARFEVMTAAEFALAEYPRRWAVEKISVVNEPLIVGGPLKALKTSIAIDYCVSLSTGLPFLGHFPVPARRRALLLSGESGRPTIQDTARRVCAAKGIELADADVLWGFKLPQLSSASHLAALGKLIKDNGVTDCAIDPLYLCMLSGAGAEGLSAANLYQTGPLLSAVAETILAAGATPILIHHFRTTRSDATAEPTLEELAYSGVREFARQWLLTGRREKYDPGTGLHKLWLAAGGSAGHGGLWAVDVEEGRQADDFTGRRWEVQVRPAFEERQVVGDARVRDRRDKQAQQDHDVEAQLLRTLDRLDPDRKGRGVEEIRDLAGIGREPMKRAVARLVAERLVERLAVVVTCGVAPRKVDGLRRTSDER